jgi:lantibiotic modifying enzyme
VLYRPEAFEPLTDEPWDDERVRAAVRALVADADETFDAEALWPAEDWDAWGSPQPLAGLYAGAAGVIWALDTLTRRGLAESRTDLRAAADRALEASLDGPSLSRSPLELPAQAQASLLNGRTGILTVARRLAPRDDLADELLELVRENVDNEADAVMWGAPGTMLAARELHRRTGEERWADAWRESAEAVWGRRDEDGLWTKRLYGETSRGLTPPHGAVGNVLALLDGGELLDEGRRQAIRHETAGLLERTAVLEDGVASWPGRAGEELLDEDGEIRLQWCSGAPGIVTAAADYLDEELLLMGAEAVWRAGPHGMEKGACICHGTAGNGYALLKAFERTGDEQWIGRARRFAVHALGQVERAHEARGRGRYSLWTGDVGTALFAADCLDGRAAYPILDSWD